MVNYYGEKTPLNQMAGISVVEGRQLMIKPYDKSTLKILNMVFMKLIWDWLHRTQVIRINVPALTEETRRICETSKKFVEDAKVALRNIEHQRTMMLIRLV
ncbi:MAG: ribosome-recycling factor [Longibaculum sp.]